MRSILAINEDAAYVPGLEVSWYTEIHIMYIVKIYETFENPLETSIHLRICRCTTNALLVGMQLGKINDTRMNQTQLGVEKAFGQNMPCCN